MHPLVDPMLEQDLDEDVVAAPVEVRAPLTPEEKREAQKVFHAALIALLPKLRVQALALTRNRAAAEDLVQDAVANALAAQNSFTPGTNFPAWMHRILRNRFISTLRKQRETTDIEDLPSSAFAVSGAHEDRLILKELSSALNRLPSDQREALFMVVLQGLSYEEVAEATGCAVGTAKSRVFRARRQLQTWLMGEERQPGASAPARTRWLTDVGEIHAKV
jgi:RNA polymerase sigma-70 factor (ECF subfamily)